MPSRSQIAEFARINELLHRMAEPDSSQQRLHVGIELANHVLALLTAESLSSSDDVIDDRLVSLPNAERQDSWFHQHPWMGGERAAFDLFDGVLSPLQGKFYWIRKHSKQVIAGGVHITENWEDRDFTRNDTFKIGVDFFLADDGKSLQVVLSNRGRLRLVELKGRLSNTQIDIFSSWASLRGSTAREQLHSGLWESFRLQSVNEKFYLGVANAFTELTQHLQRKGRRELASKLFASRLLGRLIFVWFLRSMGAINPRMNYFVSDGDDSVYYHERLEPLFFGTLNTPIDSRSDASDAIQNPEIDLDTPYLNGGLFEALPGDWVGSSSLTFPQGFFKRLFEHFEDFNFTTDESTPEYEQIAIDPEMLGRVFESLLATQLEESGEQARKAKGAFYTPREIVSFMCAEAVRSYLKRKFARSRATLNSVDKLLDIEDRVWALSPSNSLRDTVGENKEAILAALRELTVIDPACGSGAFPLGMVSTLVRIRERLEPGVDRRSLKLEILHNNIFGVDIEPMAVEISRLRAWLTIIVEDSHTPTLKALPNLDFKFVCANSLITLPGRGEDLGLFDNEIEGELESIRAEYFSATNLERKKSLRSRYEDLIDEGANVGDTGRARLIRSFNPFQYEEPAGFFDASTMFGVDRDFGIVIGNPPYISALAAKRNMDSKLRERYKQSFVCAVGAYDMYILFLEHGLNLSGTDGVLTYITPTKFLSSKYAETFRKFSWKRLALIADFSNQRIFESAGVSTMVSIFQEESNHAEVEVRRFAGAIASDFESIRLPRLSLCEFPESLWGHLKWGDYRLLSKIFEESNLLDATSSVFASSTAAEGDQYVEHITARRSTFRMVNTGTIEPYFSMWGIEEYSNSGTRLLRPYLPASAANSRRRQMYQQPKAIIAKLAKRLEAMYDKQGEYASSNTTLVFAPVEPYSVASVVAILNSQLMQYVYMSVFSGLNLLGSFQFQAPQIRVLPFPKSPNRLLLADIEQLVADLMESSYESSRSEAIKRQIDELVFKLYGLTEPEVLMVATAVSS